MEQSSSTYSPKSLEQRPRVPRLRWVICALLLFASTNNYIDRQTISVLKPHLQSVLHWSESDYGWIVFAFELAYAGMMIVFGKVIDWLGTRLGFAISVVWWSIASMAHALAGSAFSFGVARFFLGAGEAGNFPASIKSVAEWFPEKERALATGIFNAGTNIGAVLAPPIVVWLTLQWSWRAAFVFTGSLGFIWLIFWLLIYRPPREHPWITPAELNYIERGSVAESGPGASRLPWRALLGYRQAWGFIIAKFMTDPIWWFYVFWLPSYLAQGRGFTLKEIGYFAWIPFLAADLGSVLGGWLSGFLIGHGWSVNAGRKTAMLVCALCMPSGIAAVFAPNAWWALALISVSTSAHQGWSANLFTLASDVFPKQDVASVVGLGGAGGAVGGMIIAPLAGYILQYLHSYVPLFLIAGVMHPLAIGVVQLIIPRIRQVEKTA
jgi:ACS family hexuronate transporter-like MFS transporter